MLKCNEHAIFEQVPAIFGYRVILVLQNVAGWFFPVVILASVNAKKNLALECAEIQFTNTSFAREKTTNQNYSL